MTFEEAEAILKWPIIKNDLGERMSKDGISIWRVAHNEYVTVTMRQDACELTFFVFLAIQKSKLNEHQI